MARHRIHQGPFMLPKGHKPPDGLAYEWVVLDQVANARKRGWKRVPKNRHRAYGFELVQGGCLLMQRKAIPAHQAAREAIAKVEAQRQRRVGMVWIEEINGGITAPEESDVVAERSR